MTYLERKIEFFAESAQKWCGTEATDPFLRQTIAVDILDCISQVLARRDWKIMERAAKLLAVFPLLKKDAEGVFLQKLVQMEDTLLSIQVELRKTGIGD
jgi:hypothetical protein